MPSDGFDLTRRLTEDIPRRQKPQDKRETSLVAITRMGAPKEAETSKFNKSLINVDEEINRAVKAFGVQHGFSRDTFFESAWVVLQDHPEILAKVVVDATRRKNGREGERKRKRLKTMEERR